MIKVDHGVGAMALDSEARRLFSIKYSGNKKNISMIDVKVTVYMCMTIAQDLVYLL
jgi:hypothetical protein